MTRATITPRSHERQFDFEDLFFSITDPKGVIRSGNKVFARVSGYSHVQDLIGKPHNIVRHPDMPRAVFKLLWDYLGANKVFAGYVKNIATDGGYYWVMALIVPVEGGYLSLRFKPSGSYFTAVKDLYAELLGVERQAGSAGGAWRAGMAAAGERLTAALKKMGFDDYDAFMYTALAEEMAARRAHISSRPADGAPAGRGSGPRNNREAGGDLLNVLRASRETDLQLDHLFSRVESFLTIIKRLAANSSFLLDLSDEVHLISLNGLIASYRLDQSAGGLTVVTHNLATISEESTQVISEMTRWMFSLTAVLRETAFVIAAAKLQVEMTLFFLGELLGAEGQAASEAAPASSRANGDIGALIGSFSQGIERMACTLPKAKEPVAPLDRLQAQLGSALKKLPKVQVTGKVQAAHVEDAEHFQALFEQISTQLHAAKKQLQELAHGVSVLKENLPQSEQDGQAVRQTLNRFGFSLSGV